MSFTIWMPQFTSVKKSTGLIEDKIYFEKPPPNSTEEYFELRCTETGRREPPTARHKHDSDILVACKGCRREVPYNSLGIVEVAGKRIGVCRECREQKADVQAPKRKTKRSKR